MDNVARIAADIALEGFAPASERPALFLVPPVSFTRAKALDAARKAVAAYVTAPLGGRRVLHDVAKAALQDACRAIPIGCDPQAEDVLATTARAFRQGEAKDQVHEEELAAAKVAQQERAKRLVDAPADVAEKAARWVAKAPELTERMQRALALVGGVERTDEPNVYRVEGGKGDYVVKVDRARKHSECSCPDSSIRGVKCKHRLAVALVLG